MMFIDIYKKEVEINANCMENITLKQVVGANKLTDEQFLSLVDYFEEIVMVSNYTRVGEIDSYEVINNNEVMQDCPLPDGTIVNDSEFEDEGTYVVVIGRRPNNGIVRDKVGVIL